MNINELKELVENYAHCYSFVGDDTMEVARDKLYKALDELKPCSMSLALGKDPYAAKDNLMIVDGVATRGFHLSCNNIITIGIPSNVTNVCIATYKND